jgi:hypothetical protein
MNHYAEQDNVYNVFSYISAKIMEVNFIALQSARSFCQQEHAVYKSQ